MLKSLAYNVVGDQRMHCASCEQRVVRILTSLSGIRTVRADASRQRIDILFDPDELRETAIVARLRLLGYTAEPVTHSERQNDNGESVAGK